MMQRKNTFMCSLIPALGALLLFVVLSTPSIVYADDPIPTPNNGNCITCHENLYFLHDTGNWFCLRESPMTCINCHDGDPLATTKELAHADRSAHPVINEDISKCQECHPKECTERMQIFNQTAGISEVKVAVPYTPHISTEIPSVLPIQSREELNIWINFWEFLPILLLTAGALIAYLVHKKRMPVRK